MVLSDRRSHDRAQVLLLIAVVIALLLIASAITLNYGLLATLDRSEGTSTTSVSYTVAHSVESNTQSTIVASNRGNLDFDSQLQEMFGSITRDQRLVQAELDLSVRNTVNGKMLTNGGTELTANGTSDWTIFTTSSSDLISGGIAVDATNNTLPVTDSPESSDALHVLTQDHDIYIYRPVDDPSAIEALFVGDAQSTHRATSRSNPYLDLGEGSFDGKLFVGYDQSDARSVAIQNGHRANGTIEFVVTGTTSTHSSIVEDNAIFGVGVDIQLASNNEATERSIFVSHGPTRRDI